jgi:ribosome-binding ATPase YchF (GTP1/OBG family)
MKPQKVKVQYMLEVSEIFGPTIQGEGQKIGTPSVFVRFGKCNFDCSGFGVEYTTPSVGSEVIMLCAKMEEELIGLPDSDAKEFLDSLGVKESGLEQIIQKAFDKLGLQSYFTAGVKEVRAWTIRKNTKAPQAAAVIHNDFEKGFIRAEVIAYEDFISNSGEQGAKTAGKMRLEGKDYIVQDGDIMHFRFNV